MYILTVRRCRVTDPFGMVIYFGSYYLNFVLIVYYYCVIFCNFMLFCLSNKVGFILNVNCVTQ